MTPTCRHGIERAVGALSAVIALACGTLPALAGPASAANPAPQGVVSAPPEHSDGFYDPPANFGTRPPGTILRNRSVDLSTPFAPAGPVSAWQLLYRTTDDQGDPIATVTTVVRPADGPVDGLVSYQIPEDASTADCAPSRSLRYGITHPDVNTAMLAMDLGPLNALLAQGLAVSIPDYEGPDSEWGAARLPGYAVLDGIRAAEQFDPMSLDGPATRTALWGYSGGSLASGWAAQLQAAYAPELDVRGAALGGFLTDPAQAIVRTVGTGFSGVPISVLPGLIRTSPDLVTAFKKHLTPGGENILAEAGSRCMAENTLAHPFVDLSSHMDMPFEEFMRLPDVQASFDELDLGGTPPAAPLFVYHSVHDEMVPISGVDQTVASYCAQGSSVTYVRDQLSEHGLLGIAGAPAALAWLITQLSAAEPPRPACSTRTVPSMLTLPAPAVGQAAAAILDNALTSG